MFTYPFDIILKYLWWLNILYHQYPIMLPLSNKYILIIIPVCIICKFKDLTIRKYTYEYKLINKN